MSFVQSGYLSKHRNGDYYSFNFEKISLPELNVRLDYVGELVSKIVLVLRGAEGNHWNSNMCYRLSCNGKHRILQYS